MTEEQDAWQVLDDYLPLSKMKLREREAVEALWAVAEQERGVAASLFGVHNVVRSVDKSENLFQSDTAAVLKAHDVIEVNEKACNPETYALIEQHD